MCWNAGSWSHALDGLSAGSQAALAPTSPDDAARIVVI